MDSNVRIVKSLKKSKPIAEIPETLEFISHLRQILSFHHLQMTNVGCRLLHLYCSAPHSMILTPLVDLCKPTSTDPFIYRDP